MTEREVLERLIGVPYRPLGRSLERDGGLDCLGVVLEAYRLLGIRLSGDWLEMQEHFRPVDRYEARFPDVFCNRLHPFLITGVGIRTSEGYLTSQPHTGVVLLRHEPLGVVGYLRYRRWNRSS